MRIGPTEMFSSAKVDKSYVTTKFFFLGFPLFPISSYFVYNNMIELGSCRIPLNKRNVFKNYMVLFFGLLFLNQLLAIVLSVDMFTITYDLNPYYYEMIKAGVPLYYIEWLITFASILLAVYFAFRFDFASKEEIEERQIFTKCDFAIRPFPSAGYIPMAYRYLKTDSLPTMSAQLKHILFTVVLNMPPEQKAMFSETDVTLWTELLNAKWSDLMSRKSYHGNSEETLALCFIILSLQKKLEGDGFVYGPELQEIKHCFR